MFAGVCVWNTALTSSRTFRIPAWMISPPPLSWRAPSVSALPSKSYLSSDDAVTSSNITSWALISSWPGSPGTRADRWLYVRSLTPKCAISR